jgi:hypothetical protein
VKQEVAEVLSFASFKVDCCNSASHLYFMSLFFAG